MCGIAGIYDRQAGGSFIAETLRCMTEKIRHRGPDEENYFIDDGIGLGIRRLSIMDVKNGHQPFVSADGSVAMICNGEIYNYRALRRELEGRGFRFSTDCDVEVILHLYLDRGMDLLKFLNGQFAFAIFDSRVQRLFLARDHFGICPLFYTLVGETFIFGSEIKAILEHPLVDRKVSLTGLDMVFTFPGLVSPTTMFQGIVSVKPGHYVEVKGRNVVQKEYWDLVYPSEADDYDVKSQAYYIERTEELLLQSVRYRLNADVPVGVYLSGGLDSSMIGGIMKSLKATTQFRSFSLGFPEADCKDIDESYYQRLMSDYLGSCHEQVLFKSEFIYSRLKEAVYHSEAPLKETYNTCSLLLSEAVNRANIKVILSGEGADEFFGGYVGYRFDNFKVQQATAVSDLEMLLEDEVRVALWGDAEFFYEKNYHEFRDAKRHVYAGHVNDQHATFDCLRQEIIDKRKIEKRGRFNKRSYIDLKLRLCDHLISDHCDRVAYANSVEGRYPFLDIDLIEFVKTIPPAFKTNGFEEKYLLKQIARKYVPEEIVKREKFGFVAPGSPQLLRGNVEWVNDMLSYDQIKRQGFFNADTVENLKRMYTRKGFSLNLPFDTDLLIIVLTFNIFLELFNVSVDG